MSDGQCLDRLRLFTWNNPYHSRLAFVKSALCTLPRPRGRHHTQRRKTDKRRTVATIHWLRTRSSLFSSPPSANLHVRDLHFASPKLDPALGVSCHPSSSFHLVARPALPIITQGTCIPFDRKSRLLLSSISRVLLCISYHPNLEPRSRTTDFCHLPFPDECVATERDPLRPLLVGPGRRRNELGVSWLNEQARRSYLSVLRACSTHPKTIETRLITLRRMPQASVSSAPSRRPTNLLLIDKLTCV